MKQRVTITLDPAVIRRAKTVARLRHTNLSALIEELLTQTAQTAIPDKTTFTRKWVGQFSVRESDPSDDRLDALKHRYGLNAKSEIKDENPHRHKRLD